MTPRQKTIIGILVLVVILAAAWLAARTVRTGEDDKYDFRGATTTLNREEAANRSESGNIVVSSPQVGQRVGTPVVITGEARVFENTVNYRLRDKDGRVLAEGFATADAPDVGQFGPFRGEMVYASEEDGEGRVEVFTLSARDGSEIEMVTIPVRYTATPEFIKG